MPAARNQEVTVRQPRAKRMPVSSTGSRAAVRLSSQWPRDAKTLVTKGGKYDNVMAGSSCHEAPTQGFVMANEPAIFQLPALSSIRRIANNRYLMRLIRVRVSLRKSRKVQVLCSWY